jgi:ATP-binding cassette subfamily F protein 3
VHVDDRKLKRYSGNYSAFERQRAAHLELMEAALDKQQRKRAHLTSFIERFKAKASKAKQAQSRVKALARMEELAPLRAAAEFSFEFREPERAPNPLLVLEDVDAGYRSSNDEEKCIVAGINFSLTPGQRIGLLGVNGAGKSTFIKTIAGDIEPLHGVARFGKGLVIGYFAQHQLEMLRPDDSPLMHLARIAPDVREQELRNFLGRFNFPGEMVKSPIAPFSGGEKSRLALALIVWQRPNLLLLDEPTNHLDLETREALTEALAQFEGTMLLVSHDRHLLRATSDEFVIVADGKMTPFDGDLDDYRDWMMKSKLAAQNAARNAPTSTSSPAAVPTAIVPTKVERSDQKKLSAQERQRLAALKKPLAAKLAKLEKEMSNINTELERIENSMADATIYDATRKDELKSLLDAQVNSKRQLERIESEWLQLNEELEKLGAD